MLLIRRGSSLPERRGMGTSQGESLHVYLLCFHSDWTIHIVSVCSCYVLLQDHLPQWGWRGDLPRLLLLRGDLQVRESDLGPETSDMTFFVSLSEGGTALHHWPYHQHTHGHPTLHSGMQTWLTTRQNATMTSGKEMINIGKGGEKTILRPKNREILGGSEKIRWDWEFCAWKMQTRC